MKRFRGGLVFKAHRLLYHSTLGSRVIKKRKDLVVEDERGEVPSRVSHLPLAAPLAVGGQVPNVGATVQMRVDLRSARVALKKFIAQ